MGDRFFQGLLSAVFKRDFLGETNLTPELIHQELQSDASLADLTALMGTCNQILNHAASEDFSLDEVEAYARTKGLTDPQVAIIVQFWKAQKEKIHAVVRSRSVWNDTLPRLSWRIDVQSRTRNSNEELNVPTAIFELEIDSKSAVCRSSQTLLTGQGATKEPEKKIVRFEMNKQQLAVTLNQLETIQKAIDLASQR